MRRPVSGDISRLVPKSRNRQTDHFKLIAVAAAAEQADVNRTVTGLEAVDEHSS